MKSVRSCCTSACCSTTKPDAHITQEAPIKKPARSCCSSSCCSPEPAEKKPGSASESKPEK